MQFQAFDVLDLPAGKKATDWLDVATRADGGIWRLPLLYAHTPRSCWRGRGTGDGKIQ